MLLFFFFSDFTIANAADLTDDLEERNAECFSYKMGLKMNTSEINDFNGINFIFDINSYIIFIDNEFKSPNSKRHLSGGSKNKSPQSNFLKWVSECRDMANEIINSSTCLKSEV